MVFENRCPSDDEIDEYVLKRMTAAENAQIEAHLLSCADCQRSVRAAYALIEVLPEEQPLSVPTEEQSRDTPEDPTRTLSRPNKRP